MGGSYSAQASIDSYSSKEQVRVWNTVAANEGAKLRGFIKAGRDVRFMDGEGKSLLTHACLAEAHECLAALIEAGCEVDAKDEAGWTAAAYAAGWNFSNCLAILIDAGCDIDSRDAHGRTPAMEAASMGSIDCLGALMRAGCDVEAKDEDGRSALHGAVERGGASCAAALLDAGCSLGDDGGAALLALASHFGHEDFPECRRLIMSAMAARERSELDAEAPGRDAPKGRPFSI